MSEPLFFVNRGRGRAAEGPFDEARIIRLILARKILASALACQQGQLRFTPLASHPPFARALRDAKGDPLQVASDSEKPQRKLAPPPVKKNRGLLLGAILAFFGLALGAVGIGAYVMFDNGGTPAHGAVPSDTEFLFEVGSLHGAAQNLARVRALDPKRAASAKLVEDATADLSSGFAISKSQARALVLSASSLGVALRQLAAAPEGGLILTFNTTKAVNALLGSKRFEYAGLVSRNGRIYKLVDPAATSAASTSLRALARYMSGLQVNELVWFETSKVLFLGTPSFALGLARSVSLDAPSLAQNPRFQRAQRDFTDNSDAIVYLDPARLTGLGANWTSILGGDSAKAEPVAASLKLVSAGVLAHAVLRVPAESPSRLGGPLELPPAEPLTVIDRLPRETFAYVAASTKTQLSGAQLRHLLLEQMARGDAAAAERVNVFFTQTEAALHVHFDEVLGSLGGQAALAVLAPADYRVELAARQMAGKLGFLYVQALQSETPTRTLLEQLKGQLTRFGAATLIQEDASGYSLPASEASFGLAVQLRFIKGYVCIALGNGALVERSVQALTTGEGTLSSEPAHQAARAALPSSVQLFAWVDAGRVLSSALESELSRALAQSFGLDNDALLRTGPDRVTAGLAVSQELRDGAYTYRVDALNLPVFAGVFWASHAGF